MKTQPHRIDRCMIKTTENNSKRIQHIWPNLVQGRVDDAQMKIRRGPNLVQLSSTEAAAMQPQGEGANIS